MTTKKKEIVWTNLSKIDCSDYAEKKGNLTYLSWAWAWKMMMQHYPDATYKFREWEGYDVLYYKNGTATVSCEMTVHNITRDMWLPVMDHKNQAVINPSASQVAKLQAVVKQQSKWITSMETENPEIFHKVHEVYSLKEKELSEGRITNGK